MGVLRESDSSWYMREEAGGLLLGPYEVGAPVCYVDGPSAESEYELFQEDLERLGPHIETAIARVPAFGEVGVKKVYNGAIAYTPDGSPIVGPAPGVRNFWLNEGHSFGVTAAGGAGWQLAEWIVDGEPTIDMLGVDPRRFGPYAPHRVSEGEERGGIRQGLHRSLSQRGARRRAAVAADAVLRPDEGARRGVWSHLWLGAPELLRAAELFAQRSRPRQAGRVAEREPSRPARGRAKSGVFAAPTISISSAPNAAMCMRMSACRICRRSRSSRSPGRARRHGSNSILTNKIPKAINRVTLTYLLTTRGGVRAEFTLTRVGPRRFYLYQRRRAGDA